MKRLYIIFHEDGVLNNLYSQSDNDLQWDWLGVQGMLELIFLAKENFDIKCVMLSKCNSIRQLKVDLREKALTIKNSKEKTYANKLINKILGNICYSDNVKDIADYLRTQKEGVALVLSGKINDIDYPNKLCWNISNMYGLTPYDAKIINRELKECFL